MEAVTCAVALFGSGARMPATARRLSCFTESVIRAMTRLSNQHGAINLSQGFPDFDPPEELLDISSLGFDNDTAAAEWFIKEIGVAGVPGSSFFREPEHRFIRFHFAKREETLRAAGEKLAGLHRKR